jgi:hypothetical protein
MNDQMCNASKLAKTEEKLCGESLSVFGEDPTTLPMRLTQIMARLISPASGQGTIPTSGFQTVFSITHPDHSSMYFRLSDIAEIEMREE